jgi:glycosyltransferase involved in cell wall biosynthesis
MGWSILLTTIAAYWAIRILVTRFRAKRGWWAATPELYPEPPAEPDSVSICVPARDEAKVIDQCVGDLLAQDWPGVRELILVDDRSSDGTAEVALAAAAGDPRMRVIPGEGPPEGWMGKSAACWRAQQEAGGQWLCFVDADVRLHPRALSVAMGAARHHGADMVSWLGQMDTRTFWERVVMPFIVDLIALFSPLAKVNDPGRDDCLANGQFILISRRAYDAVGGHERIRASVIDDVSLSRQVKHDSPYRYTLLQGKGVMRVRMYDSLSAIWKGFAKNFYAASKEQPLWLLLVVVYLLATSVLPWVALPLLLLTGHPDAAAAAALAVAATLGYRMVTLPWNPVRSWALLLHPLGALVTGGIIVDSILRGVGLREPVAWKGRPPAK